MNEPAGYCVKIGNISYQPCFELQRRLHSARVNQQISDVLLLLEHPPVVTLGRGFHQDNLLLSPSEYERRGIEVAETDRGGDVTYHGPGQLVGYPIFDLNRYGRDLHQFLRMIEEAIIITASKYNIHAHRFPPHTGVWVDKQKICAIGIRVARWVSMHGFALNVNNDGSGFDTIIPCGINHYGVSSLANLIGNPLDMDKTADYASEAFEAVFNIKWKHISLMELERMLS